MRILRELSGFAQARLSGWCGILQTTISGIEMGRINPGVERAKKLAYRHAPPPGGAGISGLAPGTAA